MKMNLTSVKWLPATQWTPTLAAIHSSADSAMRCPLISRKFSMNIDDQCKQIKNVYQLYQHSIVSVGVFECFLYSLQHGSYGFEYLLISLRPIVSLFALCEYGPQNFPSFHEGLPIVRLDNVVAQVPQVGLMVHNRGSCPQIIPVNYQLQVLLCFAMNLVYQYANEVIHLGGYGCHLEPYLHRGYIATLSLVDLFEKYIGISTTNLLIQSYTSGKGAENRLICCQIINCSSSFSYFLAGSGSIHLLILISLEFIIIQCIINIANKHPSPEYKITYQLLHCHQFVGGHLISANYVNYKDISMLGQKKGIKIRKELFVSSSKTKNIKQDYEYIRELGSGGYGVVFLAQHKITNERRAIKTISKNDVKDKDIFATEVQLLKKMDHPNIIKLYEVYETDKTIYLVTEVCEGGQLFYLIVEKKFMTEAQAAVIMRQIFSAIAYLHEHNVCHRDLKPENILLKEKENIRSIKLIDFGIAKIFKQKQFQNQPKGTTMYLAPEIISGKYGKEVDNWACGVILYILLCGRPPFYGKDTQSILQSIKKGIYTLDRQPFYKCSNQSKDLISKLLVKDPQKRYTALKAYEHPWTKKQISKTTSDVNFSEQVFSGLRKLVTMKDLKRTLLMYLAVQIPEKQIDNVRKIFVKLDENGNGMISKDEMKVGLDYLKKQVNLKLTQDDIDQIFAAMDFDNSGLIDYSQFIASFLDCSAYMNETFLRKEFTKLDQDKDGKLNKDDIEKIVRLDTVSIGNVDVQQMINEADLDGDGKIDYNEFLVLLRQKTRTFFK